MGKNNEFGKKGEALAAQYLQQKGYVIVAQNYRFDRAEIDLIAEKENVLVIVEVKSRSSEFWGPIAETVDSVKIALLVKAANHYVVHEEKEKEIRFDIITVLRKGKDFEITHLEDAFHHF